MGGQAADVPLELSTKMLPSVTVLGSSALLKVMVTVRPLTAVLVIVGAVTSARVKVIGLGADQVLAVLRRRRPARWSGSGP